MERKYSDITHDAITKLGDLKSEITSTIHEMLEEYGSMSFDDDNLAVTINGDDHNIIKAYVCDSEDVTFVDDLGYDFFMIWDFDIEALAYLAEHISKKMEEEEND